MHSDRALTRPRLSHSSWSGSAGTVTSKVLPRENVYGHTKKLEFLLRALSDVGGTSGELPRVVDIGCGNGFATTRFLPDLASEVVAVDIHEPSIRYARDNFEEPKLKFLVGDVHSIGSGYDVAILSDVLEHVDDPRGLLDTVRSILGPQGHCLLSVPNGKGPFEIESALASKRFVGPALLKVTDYLVAALNKTVLKDKWTDAIQFSDIPYNDGSPHIQFFRHREILELFRDSGFRVRCQMNLSVLSGPFTNYWMSPWRGFCRANNWLADRLPPQLVSAWCFHLQVAPSARQAGM